MNLKIVITFIVLVFQTVFAFAQKSSYFDENLENEYRNINKITLQNPTKGLDLSKKLIEKAKNNNNPYYELAGMSLIDYVYKSNNDYKKLLNSSELTIAKSIQIKDYRREIEAYSSKSWALMHMGMLPEAKKILDDTSKIFDKLSLDDDNVEVMGVFMAAYGEFYNLQEKDEESIKKDYIALDYFLKIKNNNNRNMHLIDTYSNIGLAYSYQQKIDSAFFYFKTAKDLIPITKSYSKKSENIIYFGYGSGFNDEKKYKEAIPYLIKSLDISKKNGYEDIYVETLNQLSISFKESKNKNSPYYQQYLIAKKEYEQKNKLKSSEIEEIKKQGLSFFDRNKTVILSISILLISFFLYLTFYLLRKSKKIEEKHQEVTETVKEQYEEITELKTKVNDAFEEVLNLAKKNDASFLKRFSEVYDKLYNDLLKEYPQLSETQLKILFFSYLGFSTKDIANNTNTSPRTVQTHKYNIRKLIKISSDEDFIKWMRNF
ncbi:helix-turn-helix domain-containing protein [Chryseobacterium aquaticum]|uniref:HTH luxR-type domain-containing protein n=1 Tax=Chryseobacterium aquaticum subsp. greenlandense TaxID=345663 RepID=A0A101CCS2_9FLAO|nr:helix-turn-helix transcriptional regulator [Chryseobacterium aquaticum]KUJ53886.1 hypothetical protein AR686_18195 [Chryseobacterium aquaticum subsp. greenlandense]